MSFTIGSLPLSGIKITAEGPLIGIKIGMTFQQGVTHCSLGG